MQRAIRSKIIISCALSIFVTDVRIYKMLTKITIENDKLK